MKKVPLFKLQILTILSGPFFIGSAFAANLAELEQQLMNQNPQIKSLEANLESEQAQIRSQRGSMLPEIYIAGGYEIKKTVHEPSEGYVGYIGGTWNLFKGGQDVFENRILKGKNEVSKLELEVTKRQLRRQLREIYYTLLANKKQLALINEKEEALKRQRQMAVKKITAGLSSEIDSLEIDLEENGLKSEREILVSEIAQNTRSLSALLNSDVLPEQISEKDAFDLNVDTKDLTEKFSETPAFKMQVALEEISQISLSQKKSAFLPNVDVETRYGRITGEYADPLNGAESQVSLLLKWNIFSGFSNANQYRMAARSLDAQKYTKKNTQNEIRKDLQNLLTNKKNILHLLEYQKMRLQMTDKYYDLTLAEYKRGVKNSPDLQNATSSLFEAKTKLIDLEKDLSIINAKINEIL